MAKKDPFTYQRNRKRFPTLEAAMDLSSGKPHFGLTQGGSSRKNSGAKVAATNGLYKPSRRRHGNG